MKLKLEVLVCLRSLRRDLSVGNLIDCMSVALFHFTPSLCRSRSHRSSRRHYSRSRSRSHSRRRRSRSRSYSSEYHRRRSHSHSPMSNRRRHVGDRVRQRLSCMQFFYFFFLYGCHVICNVFFTFRQTQIQTAAWECLGWVCTLQRETWGRSSPSMALWVTSPSCMTSSLGAPGVLRLSTLRTEKIQKRWIHQFNRLYGFT